jgi:hypothetical protein
MSAPRTNVEKQEKNHRSPLIGMAAMVIFAVVLLVGLVVYITARGNTPDTEGAQIDGGIGTIDQVPDTATVVVTASASQ